MRQLDQQLRHIPHAGVPADLVESITPQEEPIFQYSPSFGRRLEIRKGALVFLLRALYWVISAQVSPIIRVYVELGGMFTVFLVFAASVRKTRIHEEGTA